MATVVYAGMSYEVEDQGVREVTQRVELLLQDPGEEGPWLTASKDGHDFHLLIAEGIPIAVG